MTRKILVTSALPYANGSIHFGHLLEHIQTDIWVRFQKMRGHQCIYVCGDDAHGTPIMISAQKRGVSPETLISEVNKEHRADFKDFLIEFDNYYTTHSEENQELAAIIYQRLKDNQDIFTKTISQAFDPVKNMFLPDRFVKGTCPRCNTPDQYGDSCEACGATYSPSELKNPVSVISGATPIAKESLHYFFDLPKYINFLNEWVHQENRLQPEVANKLKEWLTDGLKSWDISRDAPYFGFEIPDAPNKFFYVWLDAPIGYMASFKDLCNRANLDFASFWEADTTSELYHFVGKDIIYFHALFWPAMLHGSRFRTPTAIFTHGFLTIDGQKMSKSRGTFINARTYLDHLDPEYLRYYFAAKLNSSIEDIDFNMDDFLHRTNADLVGKVVNIASRCAAFINKHYANKLSNNCSEPQLYQEFVTRGESIASLFEAREYNRAVREIMELADRANQYIDEKKPWAMIKNPELAQQTQAVCSMGLNLFRLLMIYLKPILPKTAHKVETFLNIPPMTWGDGKEPLLKHTIANFEPLLQRIDRNRIEAMKEQTKAELQTIPATNQATTTHSIEPTLPEISFDDFAKIDLRIARIVNAEHIAEADKLLKLTLDIGSKTLQVFSGIKAAYNPEDLIGKLTVVVVNFAPRKMRFGVSEGMVLSAGPGGKDLWVLHPDEGAEPGMKVK